MRATEINRELVANIDAVLEYLLPNGKPKGRDWCVGSLTGEEGESLKVVMRGAKAGVWQDFASKEKGDLFGLWMQTKGQTLTEARHDAMEWLGLKKPDSIREAKEPTYRPPEKQQRIRSDKLRKFLTEDRMISLETIQQYRVYACKTPVWAMDKMGADDEALVFPHYNPSGQKVLEKYRTLDPKGLRSKICWASPGGMATLFGWHAINRQSREVVICEGETDTLTMAEYGFNALGLPFGAGDGEGKHQWIANDFESLEPFDVVYLCLDQDKEGRAAGEFISHRLGRERCRFVELPYKDVSECMQKGVASDVMRQWVEEAKTIDPDDLRPVDSVRRKVVELYGPDSPWQYGVRMPWTKMGDNFILRMAEVSLWGGVSKHGKTKAVNQVMAAGMDQGFRTLMVPLEYRLEQAVFHLVRQIASTPDPTPGYVNAIMDWLSGYLWLYEGHLRPHQNRVDNLLEVMEYAVRRYGIEMIVIDPFTKLGVGEDDINTQKQVIEKIIDFAVDHNVHIAVVAHMRKGRSEYEQGSKGDVRGSGSLTDLVHSIVIVWRNKLKQKKLRNPDLDHDEQIKFEEQPDLTIAVEGQKNSLTGDDEPRIGLWFDPDSQTFLEWKGQRRRRYVEYQAGQEKVAG